MIPAHPAASSNALNTIERGQSMAIKAAMPMIHREMLRRVFTQQGSRMSLSARSLSNCFRSRRWMAFMSGGTLARKRTKEAVVLIGSTV